VRNSDLGREVSYNGLLLVWGLHLEMEMRGFGFLMVMLLLRSSWDHVFHHCSARSGTAVKSFTFPRYPRERLPAISEERYLEMGSFHSNSQSITTLLHIQHEIHPVST